MLRDFCRATILFYTQSTAKCVNYMRAIILLYSANYHPLALAFGTNSRAHTARPARLSLCPSSGIERAGERRRSYLRATHSAQMKYARSKERSNGGKMQSMSRRAGPCVCTSVCVRDFGTNCSDTFNSQRGESEIA